MSGSRRLLLHSTLGHLRLQTSGLSLSTLPDNNTIGGCLLPLKTELLTLDYPHLSRLPAQSSTQQSSEPEKEKSPPASEDQQKEEKPVASPPPPEDKKKKSPPAQQPIEEDDDILDFTSATEGEGSRPRQKSCSQNWC